jgi:hypothetical protein
LQNLGLGEALARVIKGACEDGPHAVEAEAGLKEMTRYDPDVGPNAAEWLALTELDRTVQVEDYHRRRNVKLPNAKLHATIHVIVENQIALGEGVVIDTIMRLQGEGLTRHESVHAIATILTEHLFAIMKDEVPASVDLNERYFAGLRQLTADSWRNSADE